MVLKELTWLCLKIWQPISSQCSDTPKNRIQSGYVLYSTIFYPLPIRFLCILSHIIPILVGGINSMTFTFYLTKIWLTMLTFSLAIAMTSLAPGTLGDGNSFRPQNDQFTRERSCENHDEPAVEWGAKT